MRQPLKDLAEFQIGYQTRTGINKSQIGSHRIIQVHDVRNTSRLNYNELMSFEPPVKPDNYLVQKNNILFLARGFQNFAYHINQKLPNTVAANAFYIIRTTKPTIKPAFLTWWLNQEKVQRHFQRQALGATTPLVSKKTLAHLLIPIPPLALQEKIIRIVFLQEKQERLSLVLQNKSKQLITAACMEAIEE